MELGKLIIFGVLGLLVLSLWNGSGTTSTQKETENAAAVVTTETIEEMSESLPQTHTIPPYQALTPTDVPDTHDEANARAVDRYATYEYVRPRDPGTQNTYSYRVEGVDAYGTSVEGSVNTRGILGNGYLTTEHGDHIWIVTEWTEGGDLLGFDAEENTYVLSTSKIR
jgi:type II secretory pathway pseudopilin PulG